MKHLIHFDNHIIAQHHIVSITNKIKPYLTKYAIELNTTENYHTEEYQTIEEAETRKEQILKNWTEYLTIK